MFPGVPFFYQFAVYDAGDVDIQQGDGFAGLSYLDVGGHAGDDLLAVDQLIFDAEGIPGVDEEIVEVEDALTEPLEIAVTG